MAYTSDDIITWGKISQPIAARGEAKKKATRGATVDTDLHIKLYVERKTVEWYNNQPTIDNDILYTISNYLFALEGIYGLQAQFIDGGSGGQVTPVSPSNLGAPSPYYFFVDDTSFIANGENSKTFPTAWRGYNIVFARGGVVQTDVTTEPSYFTWDSATLFFTCEPAAVTSELFAIIPT